MFFLSRLMHLVRVMLAFGVTAEMEPQQNLYPKICPLCTGAALQ